MNIQDPPVPDIEEDPAAQNITPLILEQTATSLVQVHEDLVHNIKPYQAEGNWIVMLL